MKVGSLFSGIGGLDLGLERAGMTVAWQSEIDPYCCRVLAKHWPNVPNLGDITTTDWSEVERVDLVAGGYPPVSRSAFRASDAANQTPVIFGRPCVTPFAHYDPATSSLRTYQDTFLSGSTGCSLTLPRSGSMSSGRLCRRALWVRHIHASACSGWPTPRAVMSRIKCHIINDRRSHKNLEEVVAERGETGGYLNPTWIAWLMGYPHDWCDTPSTPTETQ